MARKMVGGMHRLRAAAARKSLAICGKPAWSAFFGKGQVPAVGHALAGKGGLQIINALGHFYLH